MSKTSSHKSQLERVAEGLLISPLFYLSMVVMVIGVLNHIGFWTDSNYDIPNGIFQPYVILPITGLTIANYSVLYWRDIQEHNFYVKRIVVFVAAWSTGFLQVMPLGIDMLAHIIETSDSETANAALDKETISESKPWLLPLMQFVSITVYPLLEWIMMFLLEWRYWMLRNLVSAIVKNTGY